MFVKRLFASLIISISSQQYTEALSLDEQLQLVIQVHQLKPSTCTVNDALIDEELVTLGDIVFNTNVLSGDRDTSCSTCHMDEKSLTDGLPISVGVGGEGEGRERLYSGGILVPRNSFTLFGRTQSGYKAFFWDGKVLEQEGKIYSPIGEGYSLGFKAPLAVAAVLPILARDEFLGTMHFFDENPHLTEVNEAHYQEKLLAANRLLLRIIEKDDVDAKNLKKAFENSTSEKFDLALVGNALSSFIASKVKNDCANPAWDQYLLGDTNALTTQQKQGAIIFYGKGRCAGCHSGSAQTDFKFHSIGTPQGMFGNHIHGQDIGRAGVTYQLNDRYQFRTPPLFYVSKTPPYGHNGAFSSMRDVVVFHLNPIDFLQEYIWTSEREKYTYNKILASRSEKLGFIEIDSEVELADLLEFLKAL